MDTSTGRIYIKITISKWKQILCELVGKKPQNIALCEKCGFYTQAWATLICDHKLCEECFNQYLEYICPKDHYRTTKDQATRGNCTQELKYAVICCPGCNRPKSFKDLMPHISDRHPELLSNADEASRHFEPKTTGYEVGSNCSNEGHMKSYGKMSDGKSLYSLPRAPDETKLDREIVTCRHCNTPLETKEVEEHEKRCPDRSLDCPCCKEPVAAKNIGVHVTTHCPAKEKKESVQTLRTQRVSNGCNVSNKRTELIGDVQEMKERIKELEDTMNRIEKPLQKIIERLSREQ